MTTILKSKMGKNSKKAADVTSSTCRGKVQLYAHCIAQSAASVCEFICLEDPAGNDTTTVQKSLRKFLPELCWLTYSALVTRLLCLGPHSKPKRLHTMTVDPGEQDSGSQCHRWGTPASLYRSCEHYQVWLWVYEFSRSAGRQFSHFAYRCGKPAKLQCPKCQELNLSRDLSAFCSQDCFKVLMVLLCNANVRLKSCCCCKVIRTGLTNPPVQASWADHKSLHKQVDAASTWLYVTKKGGGRSTKAPDFKWTGTLRPTPIGPCRSVGTAPSIFMAALLGTRHLFCPTPSISLYRSSPCSRLYAGA